MDAKYRNVFAVILAGGQSSRLFPFNKVLSDLTGSGRSLIQQAYDRLKALPKKQVFMLTESSMAAPIDRQLKLPRGQIFVDPARRGTWPAILWAMAHLRQQDAEAVMAIVTGDHVIQNDRAFLRSFRQAVDLARKTSAIVMLGIPPRNDPQEWRGFGCFRCDEAGRVVQFREKPSLEEALRLIAEGGWKWNSGMFFFRISMAERALQRLQPDMFRVYFAMASALAAGQKDKAAFLFEDFPEKIAHPLDPARRVDNSIDYAIMTPLVSRAFPDLGAYAVQDVRFRWTDLGQWTALRQVMKSDRHGNIRIGDVRVGPKVRNSILVTERDHRIEVSGINDLIVAFAGGRALVLPVADVPRIKNIVADAKGKSSLVGKMPFIASFATSKRRSVAILSNRRKEAI